MATYYVRKSGSDSNAGTSAGAAWLTIGKALGNAGISSGDTVYIGAGTYRETVTAGLTAPTVETKVIGDTDGVQTGDVGDIVWTSYTTNDKTAAANTACIQVNTKNFLTFQNIMFVAGGTGACVTQSGAITHDITLKDCCFATYGNANTITMGSLTVDTASNWTIERCRFFSIDRAAVISLTAPTSASADYDLNIIIRNCFYMLGTGAGVLFLNGATSGALTFKPGGIRMYNLTGFGGGIALGANFSASIPCLLMNSHLWSGSGNLLTGGTSGNLIEDYNILCAATPRATTPTGAHSVSDNSYALNIEIGQGATTGRAVRPLGMPSLGSPLIGFGNDLGASFKASATATSSGVSSLANNVPTGTKDGELMLTWVVCNNQTINTPTGWTQIGSQVNNSTLASGALFKRTASSEPASYTWTISGNANIAILTVTFLDASGVDGSGSTNTGGSNTSPVGSSLTPSGNANVITFVGAGGGGQTYTADRGRIYTNASNITGGAEALHCPSGLASGARTGTLAAAQTWVTFTIAVLSSTTRAPSLDILNTTRPVGAPGGGTPNLTTATPAVGAYERGNSAVKELSIIRSGNTALRIDGAGYYDFAVPVNTTATTISIYGRYNSSYGGTKPQLSIVNGTEAGVANASATMVGAADTWEQLSLTFTATSTGIITARIISNSNVIAGAAFWDDFGVA